MKYCPKCQENKYLDQFYMRRGKQTHSYCRSCVNQQTKDRQRWLKQQAVAYKGGSCERCNGKFHPAVYDFHHVDPTQKDFSIGHSKMLSLDKVKPELDKCELLCSNCHREHHAKY